MPSKYFDEFVRGNYTPISRYVSRQYSKAQAPLGFDPMEASPINRRAFLKALSIAGIGASVLGYSTPGDAQKTSEKTKTPLHQKQAGASPLLPVAVGPGEWVEAEEGTEGILQALNANEVDVIFFCSGTDNLSLMEAIAKFKALKRRTPRLITCPHEHVAMAAAHGHFMVSRRPQVVFVHVDVGTQNVGGALHNAWRGQAGVVFMAGRAPWTTHGELRGSRNYYIHWLQETFDQGEIVRQYTKWDYELRTAKQAGLVVQRAFQLSASEPCGPVYLTLPREVLMEKMNGASIYPPNRYTSSIAGQGDAEAIREAARLLVKAERPVILVNMMGRHIKSVSALVQLAELLAIPVIDNRERMNFPTPHILHMGSSFLGTSKFVKHADVVLVIDHDVPYVPVTGCPSDNTKIISIDIDPIKQTFPLWGFPIDIPITADSSEAIPLLCKMAQEFTTEKDRMRYAERRKVLEAEHMNQRKKWKELAIASKNNTPISSFWLSHALGKAIDQNTIVINEAVTNSLAVFQQIESTQPGTFFGSGGSSLGWGVGAAIGAKLAAPEKVVVCTTGDGSFMFSQPAACLWIAGRYQIPFLTVIYNNGGYRAVEYELRREYPDGYAVQAGDFNGASLEPSPNYTGIAKSCGAYAETVKDASQVQPALKRALEVVRGGQAAVLDVLLEPTSLKGVDFA